MVQALTDERQQRHGAVLQLHGADEWPRDLQLHFDLDWECDLDPSDLRQRWRARQPQVAVAADNDADTR